MGLCFTTGILQCEVGVPAAIRAAANERPYDRPIAMETRRVADYLIYRNYRFNKAFLALLSSDLIRKQSDLYSDAISSSYWSCILTQLLACSILNSLCFDC